MAKKAREIIKSYSFCKSMIYAIQAITKEKTHDILGVLVSKAEDAIVANEIDTSKEIMPGYVGEITVRDYIYYPKTKLYLGIYVKFKAGHKKPNNWRHPGPIVNKIGYSFKLPQSYMKMNQQEFDDVAIDGMLTNSSFDFAKPNIKRSKTKAEIKLQAESK